MRDIKNALVAFSGGKDSVAVSKYVREELKLDLPHIAIVNYELDYPEHIEYIKDYANKNNIDLVIYNLKERGLDFVKKNPKYILPYDSKIKSEWFRKFQQYGVKKYAKLIQKNTIIWGRRTADGNNIKAEYYTTSDKLNHYFPIKDWSNERTKLYIEDQELTPIYATRRGYERGTHTINIANHYNGNDSEALELVKSINETQYKKLMDLLDYRAITRE